MAENIVNWIILPDDPKTGQKRIQGEDAQGRRGRIRIVPSDYAQELQAKGLDLSHPSESSPSTTMEERTVPGRSGGRDLAKVAAGVANAFVPKTAGDAAILAATVATPWAVGRFAPRVAEAIAGFAPTIGTALEEGGGAAAASALKDLVNKYRGDEPLSIGQIAKNAALMGTTQGLTGVAATALSKPTEAVIEKAGSYIPPLSKASQDPQTRTIFEFAREHGMNPAVGEMIDPASAGARAFQKTAASGIWGRMGVGKKLRERGHAISDELRNVVGSGAEESGLPRNVSDYVRGGGFRGLMNNAEQSFDNQISRTWEGVVRKSPDAAANLKQYEDWINSQLEPLYREREQARLSDTGRAGEITKQIAVYESALPSRAPVGATAAALPGGKFATSGRGAASGADEQAYMAAIQKAMGVTSPMQSGQRRVWEMSPDEYARLVASEELGGPVVVTNKGRTIELRPGQFHSDALSQMEPGEKVKLDGWKTSTGRIVDADEADLIKHGWRKEEAIAFHKEAVKKAPKTSPSSPNADSSLYKLWDIDNKIKELGHKTKTHGVEGHAASEARKQLKMATLESPELKGVEKSDLRQWEQARQDYKYLHFGEESDSITKILGKVKAGNKQEAYRSTFDPNDLSSTLKMFEFMDKSGVSPHVQKTVADRAFQTIIGDAVSDGAGTGKWNPQGLIKSGFHVAENGRPVVPATVRALASKSPAVRTAMDNLAKTAGFLARDPQYIAPSKTLMALRDTYAAQTFLERAIKSPMISLGIGTGAAAHMLGGGALTDVSLSIAIPYMLSKVIWSDWATTLAMDGMKNLKVNPRIGLSILTRAMEIGEAAREGGTVSIDEETDYPHLQVQQTAPGTYHWGPQPQDVGGNQ